LRVHNHPVTGTSGSYGDAEDVCHAGWRRGRRPPGPPVTFCYSRADRVVDREPRARRALSAFRGRCAAISAGSGPCAASRASRNAWVWGSIPQGGSTTKAQLLRVFRIPPPARIPFECAPVVAQMPPWCPDEPGGLPQAGIHQVPIKVHRHRGGGVPQQPLHHLRVRASGQPQRCRGVAQIVKTRREDHRLRHQSASTNVAILPHTAPHRATHTIAARVEGLDGPRTASSTAEPVSESVVHSCRCVPNGKSAHE